MTGRLATIATTAGAVSIVDLTFDYYSDGRLHVKNDHTAGRVESFEYDDLRRLTAWPLNAPSVTSYEYDTLGNLTGVGDENDFQTEVNGYRRAERRCRVGDGRRRAASVDGAGHLDGAAPGARCGGAGR